MKKLLCTITAAAAAILLGSAAAYADTGELLAETVEKTYAVANAPNSPLKYTELADGTLEVSRGNTTSFEEVIIPREVDGKLVTSIGIFWECPHLTKVTIPDSITNIKPDSFSCCDELAEFEVDPSNNYFSSQDGVLFDKAVQRLVKFPRARDDENYIVPDSVTEIADYAFQTCRKIRGITLPDGVTSIGNVAFHYCESLTSITLPDSITSIGGSAFASCRKLKSLTLPNCITRIENGTFDSCGITSLTIPDSVTSIGKNAFNNTFNLESIVIPESVTSIGEGAFQVSGIESVTLPSSITSIEFGVFGNCHSLLSIRIPDSVTSIGASAFVCCCSLESLIIPGSVTDIGRYAFYRCEDLETLIIPNGVTSIGDNAFCSCKALKTAYIPNTVTKVDEHAFWACWELADIYYEGTETEWKELGIEETILTNADLTIHYNSVIPDPVEFFGFDEPEQTERVSVSVTLPKLIEDSFVIDLRATAKNENGDVVDLPIDANGKLDISGLSDGSYSFTFSANSCAPRSYEVTVSDGAVIGLESGVELHLFGDADGDGVISVVDVGKANLHAKGGAALDGYDLAVCDVNGDGIVDIRDVAKINAHLKQAVTLW